jgi:hypothetical protein
MINYNAKVGQIVSKGSYKNRSIEVIGVHTGLAQTNGYNVRPIVACFFLDGKSND